MATTCKLIAKNVLGSDTASVAFSGIPGTYTDLNVLISGRATSGAAYGRGIYVRLNGDTSTSYSYRVLEAYDSTVGSSAATSATLIFGGYVPSPNQTASTFSNSSIYIPNYAGSTNKSLACESVQDKNATTDWHIGVFAGLYSKTDAITEVNLSLAAGNWASGSSFFLYGITKA